MKLEKFKLIQKKVDTSGDVNEHLFDILWEGLLFKPKLIVELGVNDGHVSEVLSSVADSSNGHLISLDTKDSTGKCSWHKWKFIEHGSLEFAPFFKFYCLANGFQPSVDMLFIDTDHTYQTTKQELDAWLPYLSSDASIWFHDSNTTWWARGVMRSIEELVGVRLDETKDFTNCTNNWILKHTARQYGLTRIYRI